MPNCLEVSFLLKYLSLVFYLSFLKNIFLWCHKSNYPVYRGYSQQRKNLILITLDVLSRLKTAIIHICFVLRL